MSTEISAEDFKHADGAVTTNPEEYDVQFDLAAKFLLTAMFGWDDTVGNHITARVPGSEHNFLMHRFGLEEVTTRGDAGEGDCVLLFTGRKAGAAEGARFYQADQPFVG